MDDTWLLTIEALADAGADAIEVGIPFSDPMIDGPTIQEASLRALARGSTPDGILSDLSRLEVGIPLVVMTYYNLVYRAGHRRLAKSPSGPGDSYTGWGAWGSPANRRSWPVRRGR
jgi:tryptophan synthase alpha chain